jgi:DeoR family fructose operon transcriptional repressor
MMVQNNNFDRLSLLRQHLYAHGPCSIQDLVDAVGASPATIRRDLLRLEEEGLIERVHGGARIVERAGTELNFEVREQTELGNKRLVGDAAYNLLRPGTTEFFDNGTTVLQLAKRLRLDPLPITVFTDGLRVAQELANVPAVKVGMLGGHLKPESMSLLGPLAEAALNGLWFDQLFMGVNALGQDGRIYSLDPTGASLNQCMLARSAERHILTDSSKFDRQAPYLVAPLTEATSLITDEHLPDPWRRRLAEFDVKLIIAGKSTEQGNQDGGNIPRSTPSLIRDENGE